MKEKKNTTSHAQCNDIVIEVIGIQPQINLTNKTSK